MRNKPIPLAFWLLMIVAILVIGVLGNALVPRSEMITVREATPVEARLAALEKIAHEAPWWLDDDMKGVK